MRWVIGAALPDFASSELLSSIFHTPRNLFVALHAVAVVVFIAAYVRIEGIDPRVQVRRRWVAGLVAGALVGAILARTVLSQPSSSRPVGAGLASALLWDGALHGVIDTAAYHFGFAEFRGPALIAPLIGNAIITLSYLATGSPIAAVLSHAVMHGAAVLHGMATTVQLPPQY